MAEGEPVQVTRRRAAVLGHPVSHSLSPVLHRAAYAALGLDDRSYSADDVTEDALPAFLDGLDDTWAGLSLTMPLKQAVIELLDDVTPLALQVRAVNTVVLDGEGRHGSNTDVHGLVSALREGLLAVSVDRTGRAAPFAPPVVGSAAVLGAGATAASALAALRELGCIEPVVYGRSLVRTADLAEVAERLDVRPRFVLLDDAARRLPGHDVIVSTLPPHAADGLAAELAGPVEGLLLDVAYDPRPTALAAAWREAGGDTVDGERMLLHQAAEQVRLMTGRAAPLEAMDAALQEALLTR
ncbi:Shikimate dehydrogenase [Luteimicrobium xylanilyticum]|uniref:Shikimate dehydrogenase n=1 Tax=Luteimicrobium xylanilyticum TaxID=1133546 RepID=A0A5P9QBB3_9MICO|nr:shikimate dehydrogenase [Luteimicrobium xylanilyticum]QFU98362.1 Shikimate dehydrogenase [Luteimicrobium xylanilyticum]